MIYFAKTKESGFVKIGYAKDDVLKRVKSFQTGCPEELSIILVESGERSDESELHRIFKKSHYRGEWFRFKPDVEEYIGEITIAREYIRKAFAIRKETQDRDRFDEEMYNKYQEESYAKYVEEQEADYRREMERRWRAETESQE
jgi:hypothetical protein